MRPGGAVRILRRSPAMVPPLRLLAACATVAGLCAAAPSLPAVPGRPAPDADAIREVRRAPAAGHFTSARAVGHYLAARRQVIAGDLAAAAEELRLAVAYDDDSAELRAAHAEALALSGRLEAAEQEARRAVALEPGGRAASAAHVLLGRVLAARADQAAARRELSAAIAIESALAKAGERGDPEPWRLLSEVQLDAGDADGALATVEAAAAILEADGGAARELGRVLLGARDAARAERALRQATSVRRGDEEAWHLLAEAHRRLRRTAEALDDWLQVLRLDPDDPDALVGLGGLAIDGEDEAAAREWFGRLLRQPDLPVEPILNVGYAWLELHRGAEALEAARLGLARGFADVRLRLVEGLALQELRRWDESAAALQLVQSGAGEAWVSARQALAYALLRAGKPDEALAALEPALKARPGDPRLVSARALVLSRSGRSGEAVQLLRDVLAELERTGDRTSELYTALADALVAAGRPGEAVTELERAAKAHAGDQVIGYALGNAYEQAGRTAEAVTRMQAVLAAEPDHAEALNFLGYTWAEQGVRLPEAEVLVRRALRLAPRSGHMIDSLGWIRLRLGDTRGAVELLEEADQLIGPDPSVLDHLGDAYRAAARPADAVAAYRRALACVGEEPPAEQVALRAALERKLAELAGDRRPLAR